MNGRLAGALLIAGFVAATSPVWAFAAANPTFSSDSASPGQSVSFSGSLSGAKTSGACDVVDPLADETLTASCSYDPATGFSGWFRVPATATPGTSYLLVFCGPSGCATDRAAREWSFRDAISITAPPVVVPAVSCLSYGDAMSALSSRGLRLLKTPFPWPIGRVDPPAGSFASSGSTVTPYPAMVPTLRGLPYPSASARVVLACARPFASGPTGGVVTSQFPAPGQPVPAARVVTVYLTATSTPADSSPTVTTTPPTSSTATGSDTGSDTGTATGGTSGGGNDHDDARTTHHRAWWKRMALPTGGAAGVAALVLLGLHEWRIRRPATPMANGAEIRFRDRRTSAAWDAPRPGRLAPSFVVRRHPTTYQLREPR
jgi:hypothetical protein